MNNDCSPSAARQSYVLSRTSSRYRPAEGISTEHEGCGGSGTVFRIISFQNESFALKLTGRVYGEAACKNEIKMLRECRDSPYIVRFYDKFPCNGSTDRLEGIIIEFMDGGSLADVRKRIGPSRRIYEDILAAIAFSVFNALDYLAKRSFVHGDVHAANVLVNTTGKIKLGDFGKARKIGPNQPAFQPGITDVYATGRMLAELVLGYWLHDGDVMVKRDGVGVVPEVCETSHARIRNPFNGGVPAQTKLSDEYFKRDFVEFVYECMQSVANTDVPYGPGDLLLFHVFIRQTCSETQIASWVQSTMEVLI